MNCEVANGSCRKFVRVISSLPTLPSALLSRVFFLEYPFVVLEKDALVSATSRHRTNDRESPALARRGGKIVLPLSNFSISSPHVRF